MFLIYLMLALAAFYFWSSSYGDWKARLDKEENEGPGPFVYQPLATPESMRLLEVLPKRANEPVQLRMAEHKNPPEYRCLSYMWGPGSEFKHILVNGRTMKVRQNLYDYLRIASARDPLHRPAANDDLPIWVDAICINQEDLAEKTRQVQRMGAIYKDAQEVLIWMGCEGYFGDFIQWMRRERWKAPKRKIIQQFKSFIFQPYWERAWITQEVLLARLTRILHSSGQIDWEGIGPIVKTLLEADHADAPAIRTSHPLMLWKWQQDRRSITEGTDGAGDAESAFWVILNRRVKAKCFDSRDRVYSLLAIDDQASKLSVDYEESALNLFWRAGELLRAWSNPNHMRTLCAALDLDYTSLRRSLVERGHDHITIPVRQSYVRSALKTYMTGVMACQNGHIKHAFPSPRKTRYDLLLCPCVEVKTYDDTHNTHAMIQPSAQDDAFEIVLSREIVFRKGHMPEAIHCGICHLIEGEWVMIDSWQYLQKHLQPELPSKTPHTWMLLLPLKWVVYCIGMEERTSEVLLRLPTIESEQFANIEKTSWFGKDPLRHKFTRYVTDTQTKLSGT